MGERNDPELIRGPSAESDKGLERHRVGERIRGLLDLQRFGVLCTQGGGQPYGSIVAYAFSADLAGMAFATPVSTRKYRMLVECDLVALVVDTRSEFLGNLMNVEAVTAMGRAVRLPAGPEFDRWARSLATRNPELDSFVRAPSSALFRIDLDGYTYVTRFQEVQHWSPPLVP